MVVYLIQRDTSLSEKITYFAEQLSAKNNCICRIITEDKIESLIQYANGIIDISLSETTTIYGDQKTLDLFKTTSFTLNSLTEEESSMLTNVDSVLGIGISANTKDIDTIVSLTTSIYSTPEQHNWIRDENGWWSCITKKKNLVGLFKNGIFKVYFVGDDHYMRTGWQIVIIKGAETRLYFDPEGGQLVTGWNKIDNTWYYFSNKFPYIVQGTITIDGVDYSINQYGALVGYTGETAPTSTPEDV